MKFSDIPGQEEIKGALRQMAATGNIPHALLIAGKEGLGKMMLARAFAQYLHCEHPIDGEPCGECAACRMHQDHSHPDLHFVYPIVKNKTKNIIVSTDRLAEWKQMLDEFPTMPMAEWLDIIDAGNSQPAIYVEEAQNIVNADAYPAYNADNKIFIIWLPERLRVEAANKLLKVIEEPSPGTIFILVSNNELQLLPTIFSRTQRLHAGAASQDELALYLQRKYRLDVRTAESMASIAEGNLATAISMGVNNGEMEEFGAIYRDVMRAAYAKRPALLRTLSEKVADFGREKIRRFLTYMTRMARENFIYNLKMPQLRAMTPEEEAFAGRFSPFVNHLNVEDMVAETDRARIDIERNGNAKIVLFDFFILIIPLLHRR